MKKKKKKNRDKGNDYDFLNTLFEKPLVTQPSTYMFQVNNRNTKTKCKICSKLTIKTLQSSGVFIVSFKHISHLVLVLLLLTLSR